MNQTFHIRLVIKINCKLRNKDKLSSINQHCLKKKLIWSNSPILSEWIWTCHWTIWESVGCNYILIPKFTRYIVNRIILVNFKTICKYSNWKISRTRSNFSLFMYLNSSKSNLWSSERLINATSNESGKYGQSISNLLWIIDWKEEIVKFQILNCPRNTWRIEEYERRYKMIISHGIKWKLFQQMTPNKHEWYGSL
jgi:hypothetical protein